jgi:biofilm PGA synthesis protein PgaD
MDYHDLIIDSPDLQLASPRRSWAFVKSVGALLWFALWLPLLTVLGWYFGYETIVEQFVDRKGGIELARLLPIYLLVIGICGGSLVLWSLIQYWRFHGRNRRSVNKILETQALADFTHNTVEAVQSWQDARRVVAYHDANAHIIAVETDPSALYGKALQAAIAKASDDEAAMTMATTSASVTATAAAAAATTDVPSVTAQATISTENTGDTVNSTTTVAAIADSLALIHDDTANAISADIDDKDKDGDKENNKDSVNATSNAIKRVA